MNQQHRSRGPLGSQEGLSLIETIIALAVAGIGLMMFLSSVDSFSRFSKGVSNSMDWNVLLGSVHQALRTDRTCASILKSSVRDSSGAQLYEPATPEALELPGLTLLPSGAGAQPAPILELRDYGGYEVKSIVLRRLSAQPRKEAVFNPWTQLPEVYFLYETQLEITAQKKGSAQAVKSQPIFMTVYTGPEYNAADNSPLPGRGKIYGCSLADIVDENRADP